MFEQMLEFLSDKIENILKIGSYKRVNGADGKLQEIQIKTLRNIEEALKVSEFGFNSKAPLGSRCIVAKIGNENIVIANEHIASIIDISSGNTVIYNESGHTIKIEGDTITTTAPNIISDCDTFTINAITTNINSDTTNITSNAVIYNGGTIVHDGIPIDKTHGHEQGNDSANNTQQKTNTPS